jgi:hypothetical protein
MLSLYKPRPPKLKYFTVWYSINVTGNMADIGHRGEMPYLAPNAEKVREWFTKTNPHANINMITEGWKGIP